jgi:hypothetical protein
MSVQWDHGSLTRRWGLRERRGEYGLARRAGVIAGTRLLTLLTTFQPRPGCHRLPTSLRSAVRSYSRIHSLCVPEANL